MYFTGEHIEAGALAQMGASLVLCEPLQHIETALKFARRIASFSPTAVRLSKQILNRIEGMDVKTGYEFEQRYTVLMSGHPDSKEALRAFAERRAPNYKAYIRPTRIHKASSAGPAGQSVAGSMSRMVSDTRLDPPRSALRPQPPRP